MLCLTALTWVRREAKQKSQRSGILADETHTKCCNIPDLAVAADMGDHAHGADSSLKSMGLKPERPSTTQHCGLCNKPVLTPFFERLVQWTGLKSVKSAQINSREVYFTTARTSALTNSTNAAAQNMFSARIHRATISGTEDKVWTGKNEGAVIIDLTPSVSVLLFNATFSFSSSHFFFPQS